MPYVVIKVSNTDDFYKEVTGGLEELGSVVTYDDFDLPFDVLRFLTLSQNVHHAQERIAEANREAFKAQKALREETPFYAHGPIDWSAYRRITEDRNSRAECSE